MENKIYNNYHCNTMTNVVVDTLRPNNRWYADGWRVLSSNYLIKDDRYNN